MARRKLEELNLLDDFLFGSVVSYPGIGEQFARILLRIIFHREFGKLTVISQKNYYGIDTDKHGARLDVYLEEQELPQGAQENATVYDVEPEQKNSEKVVTALPRRVRFYHARIDAGSLESGTDYHTLKNVIIIMITPYDPFGLNRMVYTIQNGCVEEPQMPYDDGAKTLFLYTRGTAGNPPEELRQLLLYFEDTREANASNEDLREIQSMVETVKRDKEVSVGYMKIFEMERLLLDQGREEGLAEGRKQGLAEGRKQGLEEGRQEERVNTERERRRAQAAEEENRLLREELRRLKEN